MRVALTALALAAVPLVASGLAGQTPASHDRDRAAAAAKRAEDRLRTLRKEADALAAQQRTLLADLRRLELERQIAVEQLAKVERERVDVQRQLDAARGLRSSGALESLSSPLQDAARLRLRHPAMSLRELAERASPPTTKASMQRRLAKVVELGER